MLALARIAQAHRGGTPSPEYTTLNPADKNSVIVLSDGNLVASYSGGSSGLVRSVKQLSGKCYFEGVFTAQTSGSATIAIGVSPSTEALSASLGYNTAGWAFWGQTMGARHAGITAVAGASQAGDVLGVAVDVGAGKIWMRMNGAWLNSGADPASGVNPIWTGATGALFAAACPWAGAVITMRFDPATFRDVAPSGYSPVTA